MCLGSPLPYSLLTWCPKHWTEMEKWMQSGDITSMWGGCDVCNTTGHRAAEGPTFSHIERVTTNRGRPGGWHSSLSKGWTQKDTGLWCWILLLFRIDLHTLQHIAFHSFLGRGTCFGCCVFRGVCFYCSCPVWVLSILAVMWYFLGPFLSTFLSQRHEIIRVSELSSTYETEVETCYRVRNEGLCPPVHSRSRNLVMPLPDCT